jgi:HTH-type transcriptional regulator / antitoxin HigA
MPMTRGQEQKSYWQLVRAFSLRPIRSERQLTEAIRVIDGLLDRARLTADEQDHLAVLSDLVEAYEAAKHPLEPLSDADMLRFLLEEKGVTQAQAARATGLGPTTFSLVFSGKRRLTRA